MPTKADQGPKGKTARPQGRPAETREGSAGPTLVHPSFRQATKQVTPFYPKLVVLAILARQVDTNLVTLHSLQFNFSEIRLV